MTYIGNPVVAGRSVLQQAPDEVEFDPCWWRGHDYQFTRVAGVRQYYTCARCGVSYETWTSTGT